MEIIFIKTCSLHSIETEIGVPVAGVDFSR
jgi:hypothetical protein